MSDWRTVEEPVTNTDEPAGSRAMNEALSLLITICGRVCPGAS
jgi:hypothetical protein